MEGINPVEPFITFIPNCGHKGTDMANALICFLKKQNINIEDCRDQSYDNAPNMSGKYKGMQAVILEKNRFDIFVPCSAHSLNLVGKASAIACPTAIRYLNFVEELFVFFTSSTARYEL